MRKKLKQKNNLFNARKKHKTNKKIAIKKFVFIIEEILQLVKKTKTKNTTKKMCKKPRKHPIQKILEDNENETLKNENNSSNSDCIVLRPRK